MKSGTIENREALKSVLAEVGKKLNLIGATAKIYSNIFFLFFAMKPALSAAQAIEEIRKNIAGIADWYSQYLFDGVYGLQEEHLKNYLAKFGLDFKEC